MESMKIETTHLHLGIETPLKLLHVSDTHISLADEQDDERKRALLVHTGDLFDFVSHAHLALAPELMALPEDYFMAVGNHEFSLYVGEAFEDETYKMQSFDRVQAAFPKYNLRFDARVVNGVNLVAFDNVYYDFSAAALDFLKEQNAKGLPMLLFFHNPLYTPELYEELTVRRGEQYCSIIGVPVEKMQHYDDHRFRQQICTPQTQKFIDAMLNMDSIKAVFAGHLHFSHESKLANGVPQYIVGAQYKNIARLIEID